jgi:L-lactate permease
MRFNPKGLIVTAAGLLLIWTVLVTRTVDAFDNAFTIVLGVFLVVSSIAIVVARLQGRNVSGQTGALREIRRWFTNTANHQNL